MPTWINHPTHSDKLNVASVDLVPAECISDGPPPVQKSTSSCTRQTSATVPTRRWFRCYCQPTHTPTLSASRPSTDHSSTPPPSKPRARCAPHDRSSTPTSSSSCSRPSWPPPTSPTSPFAPPPTAPPTMTTQPALYASSARRSRPPTTPSPNTRSSSRATTNSPPCS